MQSQVIKFRAAAIYHAAKWHEDGWVIKKDLIKKKNLEHVSVAIFTLLNLALVVSQYLMCPHSVKHINKDQ